MALAVRQSLYQSKQALESAVSNFGHHKLMDTSLLSVLSMSRNIAFIRELEISRAGQLTCPVSCGLLFAASVNTSEFKGILASNFCEMMQKSIEGMFKEHNCPFYNSLPTFFLQRLVYQYSIPWIPSKVFAPCQLKEFFQSSRK